MIYEYLAVKCAHRACAYLAVAKTDDDVFTVTQTSVIRHICR